MKSAIPHARLAISWILMKSLPKFTQFSDLTCLSHHASFVRKHLLISELICRIPLIAITQNT
jgi:hypothetical protein